jgi:hypothetical protein
MSRHDPISSATILSRHAGQSLRPFTETPESSSLKLLFGIERKSSSLDFSFHLTGRGGADLEKLVIPSAKPTNERGRRDELWKNTCLEIFVGAAGKSSYLELNLCPSGDWNVYAFDDYRVGMKTVADVASPLVKHEASLNKDSFTWTARLAAETSPNPEVEALLASRDLVMGVTAVLEYRTGVREYWALWHAGSKPDFHLRESFKLAL